MSELPTGWATATLGSVSIKFVDGSHNPPAKRECGRPMLSARNIQDGRIVFSDYRLIDPGAFVSEDSRTYISQGDVLLTIVGALGRSAVVGSNNEPFTLQRSVAVITPSAILDSFYLSYYFRSPDFQEWIQANAKGTAQKGLYLKKLATSVVPIAPLSEQRRIVGKLNSLFERTRRAREELSHIPGMIANYKNAILEAAFRGDLTRDWRERSFARDPVSPRDTDEIKKKYRDSNEIAFSPPYSIPNEWRWFRLPELGDLDRGKSKHRPRNDPTLYGGDFPFVQTGEVREAARYLHHYSKTYNEKGLAQSRLWPVGTVCITIAANIAETAILDIDACFPDSVVGFIADKDRVSNSYIEFFLRTTKKDLEAFAPATAQKNINLDTLSSVFVPVPPMNEQIEIVSRIEKAMDWLKIVEEEQAQAMHLLDRLDQANLAKAFRGELVPQDPNDEPASVLLERICAARAEQAKNTRNGRGKTSNAGVAA
jgi:type I restriction enzyme S subunit